MECKKCSLKIENGDSKISPNCGTIFDEEQVYCYTCGKKILKKDEGLYCAKCGEKLSEEDEDSQFCPNCGRAFRNDNESSKHCSHCGNEINKENDINIQDTAAKLFNKVRSNIDKEQLKGAVSNIQSKLEEGKTIIQERLDEGKARQDEKVVKAQNKQELKQQKNFVSPDERVLATLGSGYAQNVLLGTDTKKGVATLTQKRIYYKGKSFAAGETLKSISSFTEEIIVPLEDISLTKFIHRRSTGFLIWGIIFLVCSLYCLLCPVPIIVAAIVLGLLGSVCLIKYFTSRKTYFQIGFPGGRFMFDMVYYPIEDVRDFQRQIYLAKDHFKER